MIDRRSGDFKGPKSLSAWIDVYERRAGDDVHFRLEDGEHVYYNENYGFFTWFVCEDHPGLISIPKMCGDGRFLRRLVWRFVKESGMRGVYLCSRRRPEVYCRVLGGRLDHVDHTVNLNTGRREPLYFYVVTLDDTKEGESLDKVY